MVASGRHRRWLPTHPPPPQESRVGVALGQNRRPSRIDDLAPRQRRMLLPLPAPAKLGPNPLGKAPGIHARQAGGAVRAAEPELGPATHDDKMPRS